MSKTFGYGVLLWAGRTQKLYFLTYVVGTQKYSIIKIALLGTQTTYLNLAKFK